MSPVAEDGLLRLAPESIEALAARLAELLTTAVSEKPSGTDEDGMISAARVAELWEVQRRWVYERRDELGAVELGKGPRPRLRFDPEVVAERLGAPRSGHAERPDRRRSTWTGASHRSDSLSARARANVVAPQNFVGGRCVNTSPDVAPARWRGN